MKKYSVCKATDASPYFPCYDFSPLNIFHNERQVLGSCSSLLTRILLHLNSLYLTTASPLGCCLLWCSYSCKTSQLACTVFSRCLCCTWVHCQKLSPYMVESTVWFMVSELYQVFPHSVQRSSMHALSRKAHVDKANTYTCTLTHTCAHTAHLYTDAQSSPSVWSYTSKAAENRRF